MMRISFPHGLLLVLSLEYKFEVEQAACLLPGGGKARDARAGERCAARASRGVAGRRAPGEVRLARQALHGACDTRPPAGDGRPGSAAMLAGYRVARSGCAQCGLPAVP